MNAKEILIAARAKISAPHTWIQFRLAEDMNRNSVGLCHIEARRWCAFGAILSVAEREPPQERGHAVSLLRFAITGFDSITHWNDSPKRTQDEVIAKFDQAIEAA